MREIFGLVNNQALRILAHRTLDFCSVGFFCMFFGRFWACEKSGGVPKIGGEPPKMDGENNGRPYAHPWMIWGENPPF